MHERQDNNTEAEHEQHSLKNELKEALTEVKLSKINGITQFKFTIHIHFLIHKCTCTLT